MKTHTHKEQDIGSSCQKNDQGMTSIAGWLSQHRRQLHLNWTRASLEKLEVDTVFLWARTDKTRWCEEAWTALNGFCYFSLSSPSYLAARSCMSLQFTLTTRDETMQHTSSPKARLKRNGLNSKELYFFKWWKVSQHQKSSNFHAAILHLIKSWSSSSQHRQNSVWLVAWGTQRTTLTTFWTRADFFLFIYLLLSKKRNT